MQEDCNNICLFQKFCYELGQKLKYCNNSLCLWKCYPESLYWCRWTHLLNKNVRWYWIIQKRQRRLQKSYI